MLRAGTDHPELPNRVGPHGGKRPPSRGERTPYGSERPYMYLKKKGYTEKELGKGAHPDVVAGE